jgi:trehalose-6-phosphate synthase
MGIDVAALSEKRYAVFIVTLNSPMLIDLRRNPEVAHWVQVLRQRYAGMKLIVGRDKLDEVQVSAALLTHTHPLIHLQGVRQKIQAFEAFLDKHPEFQGKANESTLANRKPRSPVTP